MRIVIFCHSLVSDWNHGNAHFLRGVTAELLARGHEVTVYEPEDAWSVANLVRECGAAAVEAYRAAYPGLESVRYRLEHLDLDAALAGADVVLVHEWNDPALARQLGAHRRAGGRYRLFFHDTHHRAVSDPDGIAACSLDRFDGVLAFGQALRDLYLRRGWTRRVWTWHEAADVRVFRPLPAEPEGDVVWIGNWGDGERSRELQEFFLEPVRRLGLRAHAYGVRYPPEALAALEAAGIEYGGWLPNHRVPEVFARFRATLHVPRRPYVRALPGIPTIRMFEALACGIPLVSAPWEDVEGLFAAGRDYLIARDGEEATRHLAALLTDAARRRALAVHGLGTIRARHTCAHRVDRLLEICEEAACVAV